MVHRNKRMSASVVISETCYYETCALFEVFAGMRGTVTRRAGERLFELVPYIEAPFDGHLFGQRKSRDRTKSPVHNEVFSYFLGGVCF